ncbi:hypothetical protein DFH09DRAFT_170376 [Mycena vulgaris]|nr:hypothetical protein DFH09DRAFT_170376 [Mycena vulgaris]
MLTFFALLAALYLPFAHAAGGAVGFLIVGDPTGVVQCAPYLINWQGGTAPFAVSVIDPDNASTIPYAFFDLVSGNSVTWNVDNLPIGSIPLAFQVSVTDSNGIIATSRTETIQAGTMQLTSSGLCTTTPSTGSTDTTTSDTSDTTSTTSTADTTSTTSTADTNTNTQANTQTNPTSTQKTAATKSGSGSSSSAPTSSADASSASGTVTTKKLSSGVIAAAAVGGVILLGVLGAAFFFLRKRHQKQLLADLTENDYHLALGGGKPLAESVAEKPLPSFYEHPTPGSTPPSESHHSGYYHNAMPAPQAYPPTGQYHEPQHSPYHDAPYSPPHPVDVASQQRELERQIEVIQQEINGMMYSNAAAHTQTLQAQVNTMRGELDRLKHGYR